MGDDFTIGLEGDKELLAQLDALQTKLVRKVVVRGLRKGARPMLAAAKSLVPVKTGALKRSLRLKTLRKKPGEAAAVAVRATAPHAHLVENVKPYMQPAFDSAIAQATQIIEQEIAKGIEEIVR